MRTNVSLEHQERMLNHLGKQADQARRTKLFIAITREFCMTEGERAILEQALLTAEIASRLNAERTRR